MSIVDIVRNAENKGYSIWNRLVFIKGCITNAGFGNSEPSFPNCYDKPVDILAGFKLSADIHSVPLNGLVHRCPA